MITKDKFGPEYIVKVYDPQIGMEGFLVVDNTALGPGAKYEKQEKPARSRAVTRQRKSPSRNEETILGITHLAQK